MMARPQRYMRSIVTHPPPVERRKCSVDPTWRQAGMPSQRRMLSLCRIEFKDAPMHPDAPGMHPTGVAMHPMHPTGVDLRPQ
jgi:hypothetical protein